MMRNTNPFPSVQNLQLTSGTVHMVVCNEEVSEQERSLSLVKEEPETPHFKLEPEPPHIKEEQQEERSLSLIKEEPETPHTKAQQQELLPKPEEHEGSMMTLLAMKCEDDSDDDDEDISSEVEIEVELESGSEVTEESDEWDEASEGDVSLSPGTSNSPAAKSQHPQRDEPSTSLLDNVNPSVVVLHKHPLNMVLQALHPAAPLQKCSSDEEVNVEITDSDSGNNSDECSLEEGRKRSYLQNQCGGGGSLGNNISMHSSSPGTPAPSSGNRSASSKSSHTKCHMSSGKWKRLAKDSYAYTVKRERNNVAGRKCRGKTKVRNMETQHQVLELEADNVWLQKRIEQLSSEVSAVRNLLSAIGKC